MKRRKQNNYNQHANIDPIKEKKPISMEFKNLPLNVLLNF